MNILLNFDSEDTPTIPTNAKRVHSFNSFNCIEVNPGQACTPFYML